MSKNLKRNIVNRKVGDEYKLLPPELSKQLTKDECGILNYLKRKEMNQSKKYLRKYGEN